MSWLRRPLALFNFLVLPFSAALAAGLLLALAAPYVHPSKTVFFAWFGLAYPFLLALNLVSLLYWVFVRRLYALLPLAALIPALYFSTAYLQFRTETSATARPERGTLRVLSLNAQLFGHNQERYDAPAVASVMADKEPDIICMQEFLNRGKGDTATLSMFYLRTAMPYGYFERLNDGRKYGDYGMVILSRRKQIRRGSIRLASNTGNMCIWADLVQGKDTLRVYNVHLQSIRFGREDYRFINEKSKDNEQRVQGSVNILRRLNRAWRLRAAQSDSLRTHMENCPYPMLVCGDFNDVPMSYTYRRISSGLKDAFREAGSGLERTYQGPFPSFRIDHMLHSGSYQTVDYKSYPDVPGDHKLIQCDVKLQSGD
jgi:endonuclease/exonuclease/phosphatase family metal-dependent hydrolase